MPFWKDGSTWVNSVTDRPGAGCDHCRIVCSRHCDHHRALDQKPPAGRICSCWFRSPVLMLPSIMALAFPVENPVLSRTGGAIVPIILVAVIAFQSLFTQSLAKNAQCPLVRHGLQLWLFYLCCFRPIKITIWCSDNTEIPTKMPPGILTRSGRFAKILLIQSAHRIHVTFRGLGYWVDTRLVAMTSGYPDKDFALWPKDYATVEADPRAKMFIVRPDQTQDLATLHQMFPNGFETYHTASIHDHDFITFFIPPVAQ